ncbi:MAG: hypothetical protein JXA09_17315, partial [Anaerolineae bacterium]|nr:hypothetical protein [Anaerolineae bacterium]
MERRPRAALCPHPRTWARAPRWRSGCHAALLIAGVLLAACASVDRAGGGEREAPELPPQVVLPTPDPAAAIAAPLCPPPQPPLVEGLALHAPPALAEPAPRVPFRDPVFGTCLVRVTDRRQDLGPDDRSRGIVNEYARVGSFNADGSLLLARSVDANWYLYDARSLRPLGALPLGDEPRWDADDPDVVYYTDDIRLMAYDVRAGTGRVIHDFAPDLDRLAPIAVWTRYEGRPSMDTRYWGLMAEDARWIPVAFLVYDRLTDQVTIRDMRNTPGIEEDVDHVTISPRGTYYLASYDRACERGGAGDDAHPCGLMVYDRDLEGGRSLLRIIGHYDTALDAQGREVIVYQDIDTDQIAMLDLESGQVTPLWPIDFAHTPIGFHFSGLAYERPGWALISTYSGGYPEAYTWMDDQVFAIELRAGGRVARLAHTHSLVDPEAEHDYWAEPHATTNGDMTRILFTSNWGRSGSEEVDMYMIELAPDWTETLGGSGGLTDAADWRTIPVACPSRAYTSTPEA